MISVCDRSKKERILGYRDPWDAHRSLMGDLLARFLIGRKLEVPPDSLGFERDENGKPSVVSSGAVHFNLAHSGEWIVCATGGAPVGVDTERMDPVDLGVANRFFAADEIKQLETCPEEDRIQQFYTLWTLKESYLKMTGHGLDFPLNGFCIDVDHLNEIRVSIAGRVDTKVTFGLYSMGPDYMTALCAAACSLPSHPVQVETKQLIDFYQRIL